MKTTTTNGTATTTTNALALFREVELDQKLALIQEYDHLEYLEREEWRVRHGADSALLTYYRRKYLAEKPETPRRGRPLKIGRTASTGSNRFPADLERRTAVQTRRVFEAELVEEQEEVSLADAILAFEVKRDHMNEFIEELHRIRKGGR